jgi:cytidyltransferase-like protein
LIVASEPGEKILSVEQVVSGSFERPIGLCWGGFDFLHAGHIFHFEFAKSLARTLIVAINADEAFPAKGPGRPFLSESRRLRAIAAISFVDIATVYRGAYLDPGGAHGIIHGRAQSTPFVPVEIITTLRPDYYFKGIEYESQTIPERALVEDSGGRLVFGPREPILSSSRLLQEFESHSS